jgi:hypothetical protein
LLAVWVPFAAAVLNLLLVEPIMLREAACESLPVLAMEAVSADTVIAGSAVERTRPSERL